MDDDLRIHVGLEDHILFQPSRIMQRLQTVKDGLVVGIIIGSSGTTFQVRVFYPMTSECLQNFSLPPITAAEYPLASQSHMVEIVLQETIVSVERSRIFDIAFVLPLHEAESGLFHMSGSYNSFFIRYGLCNGTIQHYRMEYYFATRPVEPVSIRLFHSLNHLAQHIKKSLYHQGEAVLSRRNFRLHFSSEAFCYMFHKLSSENIVSSTPRQQAFTMYYDSLTIEARTKCITKTYIRIITKQGLNALKKMLGIGVGLGLTKRKPNKKSPLVHCTENSFLTSVELGDGIPTELLVKPLKIWHGDLVDFTYTNESRQLSCNIQYTKLRIYNKEVALSRIPTAEVHNSVVGGAYVSAQFHYDGQLMSVIGIVNKIATCVYLHDDIDSDDELDESQIINLPLEDVDRLVSSFGM
jgi:hypothetical protein